MANENMFLAGNEADNYWSSVYGDGYYTIGNKTGTGNMDGALRFPGVTGSGTPNHADLYFHVDDNGGTSGIVKMDIYGIDEDNTGLFTGSPMGRPRTTASIIGWEVSVPSEGGWAIRSVRDLIGEIRARGGWSSGNALGFLFYSHIDTDPNAWFSGGNQDVPPSIITHLEIRESAEPDFTPTPKTVAAPTFPAADSWGIKVSYANKNVFTATDEQTYYTSKKRVHKILAEGKITTQAGVTYLIAHGQSVIPFAMAYMKSPNGAGRFKIPRYFAPGMQADPFTDTMNGTIELDATNLRITTSEAAEVYYYIFIDELST